MSPALDQPFAPFQSVRRLAASVALLLTAVTALAEPPRYEIELVDRAAIEAPSDALPSGGTLVDLGLAISKNGRWVVGEVRDNRDGLTSVAYRIDRDSGTVEILGDLRGYPPLVPQINDAGHVVARLQVDGLREVAFWSEETGVASIGPATPAFSVRSLARNRYFNNADDVLVRPLPADFGLSGATLWNPMDGTQVPLPYGAAAINDTGLVVGWIERNPGFDAFVWDAESGVELLTPPAGEGTEAFSIDDAGRIVGEAVPEGGFRAHAVLWPERSTSPVALDCPAFEGTELFHECAALHVDQQGRVYGGADFEDHEPLTPLVWDGTVPYQLDDLLLDPNARCGYAQVSDFGELSGGCVRFDPDLGVVVAPAILHPVFPGLSLVVTSPLPEAVVPEGTVVVKGTASDDGQILSVAVNDVEAELDSTGNPEDPAEMAFAVPLLLCPGTYPIVVVAMDDEGNTVVERFQIHVVPGATRCDGGEPELDCSHAVASPANLWPPNHELETIGIVGVGTADGGEATIRVTGVRQDEPVEGGGDGDLAPDAFLGESGVVAVRRERSGSGDGRIYEIAFEASDGVSSCTGAVLVGVPHDQGKGSTPVDSGVRYDATGSVP